jgi:DNA-binding NarL/FixJ family response regulator
MVFQRTPCVLVMSTDILMKRALARLLNLGSDVEIVVSEAGDIEDLMDDIYKTGPDVVLFSESIPFSQRESLTQLLMLRPTLRLIVASEETNLLNIFSREERAVTELNDLLTFINAP